MASGADIRRGEGGRLGVVIVAAGSGTRFGSDDKIFTLLSGRPILLHALDIFAGRDDVDAVAVVLGRHTLERGSALVSRCSYRNVIVCEGGETRGDSVMAGIDALPPAIDLVAVHDAARPLTSVALVDRVVRAARVSGAAMPGLPVSDTVHETFPDATIARTLERSRLWAAQTPQVARREWLEHSYRVGGPMTDEAGRLHAAGHVVHVVEGDPDNIKITWPGDLTIAEALLSRRREATT
jgi:2-C-methyl-D-erythritol 4-phosphate cytidylyltransferase